MTFLNRWFHFSLPLLFLGGVSIYFFNIHIDPFFYVIFFVIYVYVELFLVFSKPRKRDKEKIPSGDKAWSQCDLPADDNEKEFCDLYAITIFKKYMTKIGVYLTVFLHYFVFLIISGAVLLACFNVISSTYHNINSIGTDAVVLSSVEQILACVGVVVLLLGAWFVIAYLYVYEQGVVDTKCPTCHSRDREIIDISYTESEYTERVTREGPGDTLTEELVTRREHHRHLTYRCGNCLFVYNGKELGLGKPLFASFIVTILFFLGFS